MIRGFEAAENGSGGGRGPQGKSHPIDDDGRWEKAFCEEGEVGREKLGAAHRLLHGIGAFQADGKGGRTDLIFGEPIDSDRSQMHLAEVLVLTEWKKATKPRDGRSALWKSTAAD